MGNWYSMYVSASSKDDSILDAEWILDRLSKSIRGCGIDSVQSQKVISAVIDRIDGRSGARLLMRESVKNEVRDVIADSMEVALDSPKKFAEGIQLAVDIVNLYLLELDPSKGAYDYAMEDLSWSM